VEPSEHNLLGSLNIIFGFDEANSFAAFVMVDNWQLVILGAFLTSKEPQSSSLSAPPQITFALTV
jgi:hypothetical protein